MYVTSLRLNRQSMNALELASARETLISRRRVSAASIIRKAIDAYLTAHHKEIAASYQPSFDEPGNKSI